MAEGGVLPTRQKDPVDPIAGWQEAPPERVDPGHTSGPMCGEARDLNAGNAKQEVCTLR